MHRDPTIALPVPRSGPALPLLLTGSLLAWLCRGKAEPRPPTPTEMNETKVTRHEHA